MKRGSIFLKFLNEMQLNILENGIFSKWQRDFMGSYKYMTHMRVNYESEVLSLTLQELSGSFYVLIFGLILGIIALFIELIYIKICK